MPPARQPSADGPILLLTSLHLPTMPAMWATFWRVRDIARVMLGQPGCLKVFRWSSRRSLLIMSWWRDEASLSSWLDHSEHSRLLAWVRAHPNVGFSEETFRKLPGGTYQGKGVGTPKLPTASP